MARICRCLNCITPPHLLRKLLESKDKEIRRSALNTLLATARLRGERSIRASVGMMLAPGDGRRTIFDCQTGTSLPSAAVARTEDGLPSPDESVERAFEGFGAARDFYEQVFERNSIDNNGMRLNGYVHRGVDYNNAFWDGQQMVFGDGDGIIFTDFTKSLDVIGHELAHGVTEHTAGLEYHLQSGALNESMSDVFGSLVKQWSLAQTADQADWLIGADVFTPGVEADALRSMKAPGTAYDNPDFGRDPQPDHMSRFVQLPDTDEGDNGGVHINSGIPNKAFYLTAVAIGGNAWQAPGRIWYESLKASGPTTNFQEFADTTYAKAGQLFKAGYTEQQAVLEAWRDVGIRITGVMAQSQPTHRRTPPGDRRGNDRGENLVAALTKELAALSAQMKALAKDVGTLKAKK